MTKAEYADYCDSVAQFFAREDVDILAAETDDDTGEPKEPGFSRWPCECCGRGLAGNRTPYASAKAGDGPTGLSYDLCDDCVYYVEYGRLDDSTMMAVESSDR